MNCLLRVSYNSHVFLHDFKYEIINKFNSIDNTCHTHKKLVHLSREIYLITSPDNLWMWWEEMFRKHKSGELIDLDIDVQVLFILQSNEAAG